MFYKVWSVLLGLASISWFVDAVRVMNGDKSYTISIVFALILTGLVVAKWSYEAWNEK